MLASVTHRTVTLSKLHRPRLSGRVVQRVRLLEQLSTAASLALVIAPAGYGKTTLLSSWLETCDLPSAWLSLDEHDNDLVVFGNGLVAAVRLLFPAACQNTLELLNGMTTPPVEVITHTLSNDLSAVERDFILVLDDYQRILDPAIHNLMTDLTGHLPQPLHLVLATRSDPPLPLFGLRARGHVIELREADLRFSQEETASLLREDMRLEVDDRVVADLHNYTEGWVAGLRLAALYLQHTVDQTSGPVSRLGSNRYIAGYLVAEVLAHVPGDIQDFLLKTSILDRFCVPLCQSVTGSDAAEVRSCLAWLERNNAFLRFVDEERRWYLYHHLFQKLLIDQLEQQQGRAEMNALHLKASAWFASNGYAEDALRHALAAGDTAAAVQIVAQGRWQAIQGDQWHLLNRWLHLFPRAVIDTQPDLLLAEAWLMRLHNHLSEMTALVGQAENLIGQAAPEPLRSRQQGEIEALRAIQYYSDGDGPRTFSAAQVALDKAPPEWWFLRAQARLFLSFAYQMKGELAQAYATLYDSGEPDLGRAFQMRLFVNAGFVHWIAADLAGMAQAATQVLAWSDQSGPQVESTAWARYFLGIFHFERNNLAEAERYLAHLVLQPYQGHVLCSLNSAAALALIRQVQGQPDQACEIAEIMVSLAFQTRSAGALALAKGFQAELALRQGRLAEAGQWAEQFAGPLATPVPHFYRLPSTLVRILLALNTPSSRQRAGQVLASLDDYHTSIHYTCMRIEVLALQALLYQTEGNEPAALEALAGSLGLAEPGGYVRTFVDLGEPLERLLAALVGRQGAVPYATRILTAFRKTLSSSAARQRANDALAEPLTPREIEVLELLEKHYTDREIADALVISLTTVRSHVEHSGEKLGAHGRHAIVDAAKAQGLL